MDIDRISALLGDEAHSLLDHRSETIPADQLHLPGGDMVDRILSNEQQADVRAA